MTTPRKTSTPTLVSALRILAGEIESPDGVANMAIGEGADRINELAAELARVTAERDQFAECVNKSESVAERGNLVGEIQRMEAEIKRLEHENDGLERRRQYETDLVCAAVIESNARGVSFGSAELCARVDEIRALRARVAELEEKAERYRLTTLRQDARVAELDAALREMVDAQDATVEQFTATEIDRLEKAMRSSREILARAKPADLAQEACGGRCGDPYCNLSTEGELMRDAARKQGGAS